MKKIAFLDRDGIINVDFGYVFQPHKLVFVDGIIELLQLLQSNGYELVVVTNQSGIARGFYTEEEYYEFTNYYTQALEKHGISFLDILHCPHHASGSIERLKVNCEHRKPNPGMILHVLSKYKCSPLDCLIIGDKPSDIVAGSRANLKLKVLVSSTETSSICDLHADSISELTERLTSGALL